MLPENMSIGNRLQKILFLLKKRGRISTKELSRIFDVSEVTIRTDLNELSRQGLVIRDFGGAMITSSVGTGNEVSSSEVKEGDSVEIAAIASGLIEEGEVIFLDNSRESRLIAESLRNNKQLTIVTNSIEIAYQLSPVQNITVYIISGVIEPHTMTILQDKPQTVLSDINISKAFFSATGFSLDKGISDTKIDEIAVKKEIILKAENINLLIPSIRIGKTSLFNIASPEGCSRIITDSRVNDSVVELLHEKGIECLHALKHEEDKTYPDGLTYKEFSRYRQYAVSGEMYPGNPGRGKVLAVANGNAEEFFCMELEKGIRKQAALAGFSEKNIYFFDNAYDEDLALDNADKILKLKPDFFIEFQVSQKLNSIIAAKFENSGIPVIGVEVPVPSAPYIGVNNWQAGTMAGEMAALIINKKFGGWDNVDLVILIQMPNGSVVNMFRTEAFAAALVAEFGDEVENKIVRTSGEVNTAESVKASMERILEENPDKRKIAITTVNNETMWGVIDVLKAKGRWNKEELILIAHACNPVAQEEVRNNLLDGGVVYFPELYGEHIIPAVCSILSGSPIPSYVYIKNESVKNDIT